MTQRPRWTFITNHGLVLSYIFHNPRSTAREIANYIGVTERTTHKIISDLEDAGYIQRRRSGRRNVYRVDPDLPLRHHTKQDILVAELLEALTSKERRHRLRPLRRRHATQRNAGTPRPHREARRHAQAHDPH